MLTLLEFGSQNVWRTVLASSEGHLLAPYLDVWKAPWSACNRTLRPLRSFLIVHSVNLFRTTPACCFFDCLHPSPGDFLSSRATNPTLWNAMATPHTAPEPASLSAKSRRSSISAIPRPISGTSRHATPTASRGARKESPAMVITASRKPHMSRKSSHRSDGLAPNSFRMSQAPPSSTEYSRPYQQRSQQDLSGFQQQLNIRNWSTHSLNVSAATTTPHQQPKQTSSTNALPKSRTMGSLLSSPREIVTRRRLMQPIGPPLPRTQTLGNISCFSPPSRTPSPRKSKSVTLSPPQQQHTNGGHLCITDALAETRMSDKRMDLMGQVQRETASKRARLRNSYQSRNLSQHAASEAPSRDAPTVNLSLNDVANTHHLEVMKRRSSSGRLLFINSALANTHWQNTEPPTTSTVTSIGSVTSSEPSGHTESDLKHVSGCTLFGAEILRSKQVYVAEPTAYWTGRYVSVTNRLRMRELNMPMPSPSETSEKQIDRLFESNEKVRMNAALNELRGHCQTNGALKSFEEFECQFLKKAGISRQSLHRAGALANGSKDTEKRLTMSRTMPLAVTASCSPDSTCSPMSRVSSIDTDAWLSGKAKAVYGAGSISKSKTTGNLASLMPTIPKRRYAVTNVTFPKSSVTQPSHTRKLSYLGRSPETSAKALKGREDCAARRAGETHRRSLSQVFSLGAPKRQPSSRIKVTAEPNRPKLASYDSHVSETGDSSSASRASAFESGHRLEAPASSVRSPPSRVELVNMSGRVQEKLNKSRRRSERQFSGDMVKNLLGAGVREVRKMGRRVSGMSWPGSGEE